MCELTEEIMDKEVTGYKMVAVNLISGNYFSVAMGFKYNDKLVPKIRVQKVMSNEFTPNILVRNGVAFRLNMIGRTAIFINKKDALKTVSVHKNYGNCRNNFEIKLKKATLSIDLMKGYYGGNKIVAGRKIRFLD